MWNLQLVELSTLLGSKTENRAVSSQKGNCQEMLALAMILSFAIQ